MRALPKSPMARALTQDVEFKFLFFGGHDRGNSGSAPTAGSRARTTSSSTSTTSSSCPYRPHAQPHGRRGGGAAPVARRRRGFCDDGALARPALLLRHFSRRLPRRGPLQFPRGAGRRRVGQRGRDALRRVRRGHARGEARRDARRRRGRRGRGRGPRADGGGDGALAPLRRVRPPRGPRPLAGVRAVSRGRGARVRRPPARGARVRRRDGGERRRHGRARRREPLAHRRRRLASRVPRAGRVDGALRRARCPGNPEKRRRFRTLEASISVEFRPDSGSFLGTSESSLHEFSRSGHTKVARIDSYTVMFRSS